MTDSLSPLAAAAQAQSHAADPAASAWVAASAGTGKTKVLTDRVLSLLLSGTPPTRLLCLTFTKAAAAEMANRLHDQLGHWAAAEDGVISAAASRLTGRPASAEDVQRARRLFAEVLDAPGGIRIQTIHGFCQALLRRFPLEAGVAPHFSVIDERTAAEMLEGAREEVLARARQGEDETLARALAEITQRIGEYGFAKLMREFTKEQGRLAPLLQSNGQLDAAVVSWRASRGLGPEETAETIVAQAGDDRLFDRAKLRWAAEALAGGTAHDTAMAAGIRQWLASDPAERQSRFGDYVALYSTPDSVAGGLKRKIHLVTQATAAANPGVGEILESEADRVLGVERRLRGAKIVEGTTALLRLGGAMLATYRRHKTERALLDYDDLILAARSLLRGKGSPAWVLYKLDGGIDHILIDEAQDTNPEQWEVVTALAEEFFVGAGARPETRTVFAVGDAKQSIFSFQRADPEAFDRLRRHFGQRVRDSGGDWREVPMETSFRSVRAVLDAVDAVFARPEAANGVVAANRPMRHAAARIGAGGLVEVWPLVQKLTAAEPLPWQPPVVRLPEDSPRARLAGTIARRIHAWVRGPETEACGLPARGRRIRASDVMVLVRRRSDFVENLVRALKTLDIPVAGVDRMVLAEQMAVMDLIALGRFLLLPDDDLTLATVLNGPFVGLDETALFELAHGRGARSLWAELRRRRHESLAFNSAANFLSKLLTRADFVPPYEFYGALLGAGGGRQAILGRLGPEAADPIDEFLALALIYERAHPPSLEGFLHWIEAGAVEVKRDLEHGVRDEVRVLTVHGAKGLQAPIVFLADTTDIPRQVPPILWTDTGQPLWSRRREDDDEEATLARLAAGRRRDQEYRRLLYVAMTRAEDRLYVCGWTGSRGTLPPGCWYDLIANGLRNIATTAAMAIEDGVQPGQGLRLEVKQLGPAVPRPSAPAPITALGDMPSWVRSPPSPEPEPPAPLIPSRPAEEEPAITFGLRQSGELRFVRGRLAHRLLQRLPELAEPQREAACRRFLARPVHGLPPPDQDTLARQILAVIADPALAPLFAAGSLAELPIVGQVRGRVISGRIDRLAVADGRVMVVDYKTSRSPPASIQDVPILYLKQMAAYRTLLEGIYQGLSIDCFLLWTDGPACMFLPGELLDRYAP